MLYIVLDDVGFSALSSYGGPIETPNMDRIASAGVRYTQWHTTALCSPTRSCLLTGRNHTRNSMACITEAAIGFLTGSAGAASKDRGLVSSTVADLVVGSGVSFAERGEHELKGVPGRWKVLAVGDSAARTEPLRAAVIEREMTVSDRVTVGLARRAPGPLRAIAGLGRRAGRRRPEAKPR